MADIQGPVTPEDRIIFASSFVPHGRQPLGSIEYLAAFRNVDEDATHTTDVQAHYLIARLMPLGWIFYRNILTTNGHTLIFQRDLGQP